MKLSGVVVLYNPNEKMLENIKTYIKNIEKLFIVDNSLDSNFEKINLKLFDDIKKIKYIPNYENKGIAYALNIGIKESLKEGYEYLLTMDQDSFFEGDAFKKYLSLIEKDLFNGNLYGVSTINEKKDLELEKEDFSCVEMLISSGMIIDLKILEKVGLFNEDFFIDEVDNEFCYRVKNCGYIIKKANKIFLNHKLGNLRKHLFNTKVAHHNYIRKYYIFRNRFYITKMYPERKKAYLRRIRRDVKKIILYEKDKWLKLKMFWYAYRDFKNGIKGKISEKYLKKEEK